MTTLSSAPQTPTIGVDSALVQGGGASPKRARRSVDLFAPNWRQRTVRYFAIAVVLGLWQATGDWFHLKPIFLSTPSSVATAFYDLMANGILEKALGSSIYILAVGICCSGIVGISIGTLLGRIQVLERALDPIVTFGNATPSIALLPLMEIWFGEGKLAGIIFIFIIGLWQMIVNTLAGMRVVRNGYRDVGASFGMTKWEQTWKIYLPATQPFIFAGARISLAQCTVGMILAGQELGQGGLGGISDTYGTYFETDKLVAVIVMVCALALTLFASLRGLQAFKYPWIKATSAGRRGGR